MTIKKSDRDMLVRRDAEGREEFVAWGSRTSEEPDGDFFRPHDARSVWHVADRFTVIPRDRIEVTDDVADLGPGWRVRVDRDGIVTETTIRALWAGRFAHENARLLSAWRVLPETPSGVEALASAVRSSDGWALRSSNKLAEHLHAQGYRKVTQ